MNDSVPKSRDETPRNFLMAELEFLCEMGDVFGELNETEHDRVIQKSIAHEILPRFAFHVAENGVKSSTALPMQ